MPIARRSSLRRTSTSHRVRTLPIPVKAAWRSPVSLPVRSTRSTARDMISARAQIISPDPHPTAPSLAATRAVPARSAPNGATIRRSFNSTWLRSLARSGATTQAERPTELVPDCLGGSAQHRVVRRDKDRAGYGAEHGAIEQSLRQARTDCGSAAVNSPIQAWVAWRPGTRACTIAQITKRTISATPKPTAAASGESRAVE